MKSYLVLSSGELFEGVSQQKEFFERAGEVVFNTSHSGYEEVATDPSYFSQIMVMTAPMQGNYGTHESACESKTVWIEGFVCVSVQNSERERQWLSRMESQKVSVLSEVDTRKLVLRLRQQGTTWGALVQGASEDEARNRAQTLIKEKKALPLDWVYLTTCKVKEVHQGDLKVGPRLGVLDFGTKENILREVKKRSSEFIQFPARTVAEEILASRLDGLVLTNGPGDPSEVQVATQTVKALIGKLPIFGICMGHQILSLALGAKTYKLKFGHRGSNHPIRDSLLNRIYMTSQNHGYAVDPKTLPSEARVTQVNLNDETVAGIYSEKSRCLGIQYHPESCPGPHDARGLFDYFVEKML